MEMQAENLVLPEPPSDQDIINGVRYLMRNASADYRYATFSGADLETHVDDLLAERRPAVKRDLTEKWDHYFPDLPFNEIRLNTHLDEVMAGHRTKLLAQHRQAIKAQVKLWRWWNILEGRELFFKKWDLFWLLGLLLLPVAAVTTLVCLGTPSDFWFNLSWKIPLVYIIGMGFIKFKSKTTDKEMYS